MQKFIEQARQRNIWRVLVAYPSVSFVLLQAVEFGINHYGLDARWLTASLIAAVILLPAAVVWNWRHGERGEQAVSRAEVATYGASAIAVVAAVVTYWSSAQPAAVPPASIANDSRRIAVMPFRNAGDNAAVQYLCDGIAENLINWLATIPNVRVVSKSASFRLRDEVDDTAAVARQLDANTLLTGDLQVVDGNVIVSAELVDLAGDSTLWGDRLSEPLDDVLQVERSLVAAIKDRLQLSVADLSAATRDGHTTDNPDAYSHYLRGHYLIQSTNVESINDGIDELRAAIRLDPGYARPYADIADSLSQMISYGEAEGLQLRGEARTAGLTAVALAPDLAEAHTALATVNQYFDFDWRATDAAYEAAVALNPRSPVPYHRYTDYLVLTFRFERALEMARRALAVDALDSSSMHALGLAQMFAGDFAAASEAFGEWNRFHPNSRWSYVKHALALSLNGQCEEAARQIDRVESLIGGPPALLMDSWIAWGFKVCDNRERYALSRDRIRSSVAEDFDGEAFGYVYLTALEGNTNELIELLERLFDEGHPLVVFSQLFRAQHLGFGTSPSLPSDPRYLALLERIGFPPIDEDHLSAYQQ